MKWVAKYYKMNNEKIVTNVWDKDAVMIPEGDYVTVKQDSVIELNNALVDGKKILIKKTAPKTKELSLEHFKIIHVTKVEVLRKKMMEMLSKEAQVSVGRVSAIDFFEYLELFLQFLEKGVYITEKNREEKYLEIINTGDVDTIKALERYLEIRDHTLTAGNAYKNIRNAKKRVFEAKTLKELDIIYDEYKRGCA